MKKEVGLILLCILLFNGLYYVSAGDLGHDADKIYLRSYYKDTSLQDAINNRYLGGDGSSHGDWIVGGGSWGNDCRTSHGYGPCPPIVLGHLGSDIWINLNGTEMSLQQAINNSQTLCCSGSGCAWKDYTKKLTLGHFASEIMLTNKTGSNKSLQQTINDREFCTTPPKGNFSIRIDGSSYNDGAYFGGNSYITCNPPADYNPVCPGSVFNQSNLCDSSKVVIYDETGSGQFAVGGTVNFPLYYNQVPSNANVTYLGLDLQGTTPRDFNRGIAGAVSHNQKQIYVTNTFTLSGSYGGIAIYDSQRNCIYRDSTRYSYEEATALMHMKCLGLASNGMTGMQLISNPYSGQYPSSNPTMYECYNVGSISGSTWSSSGRNIISLNVSIWKILSNRSLSDGSLYVGTLPSTNSYESYAFTNSPVLIVNYTL